MLSFETQVLEIRVSQNLEKLRGEKAREIELRRLVRFEEANTPFSFSFYWM